MRQIDRTGNFVVVMLFWSKLLLAILPEPNDRKQELAPTAGEVSYKRMIRAHRYSIIDERNLFEFLRRGIGCRIRILTS